MQTVVSNRPCDATSAEQPLCTRKRLLTQKTHFFAPHTLLPAGTPSLQSVLCVCRFLGHRAPGRPSPVGVSANSPPRGDCGLGPHSDGLPARRPCPGARLHSCCRLHRPRWGQIDTNAVAVTYQGWECQNQTNHLPAYTPVFPA